MPYTLPDQAALTRAARAFNAKKHLGQHFLVDPESLGAIADHLEIKPGDIVLEIGPGLGFLTEHLLSRQPDLTAVELDPDAAGNLGRLNSANFHLVHGDFLHFDIGELSRKTGQKLKIAGNVPYQITAPILHHLFGEIDAPAPWLQSIDSIVLTVQKEVAERFVAVPGHKEYSQITLMVNYFSKPSIVAQVPRDKFSPVPNVDSSVVKFKPLPSPAVTCQDTRLLRRLIRAGFSERRKMIRNNLTFPPLTPEDVNQVFRELNFDPQVRAERLSLSQFAMLADAVHNIIKSKS